MNATIKVVDASGVAVSDAAVTVRVSFPDGHSVNRTRTTGASGKVNVSVASALTGTYTFAVTNIVKAGLTYDPAANVETSDSITVP